MGMTNALNLLCGLALFLYGMHVMGEGADPALPAASWRAFWKA